MDVPETVRTALEDRSVEGAVCLEAGAGTGNTTAGLLEAGASRVYAVTDDPEHARTARRRVRDLPAAEGTTESATDRVAVLQGDLRATPLPDGSVEFVTAHGLFNVVPTAFLAGIAAELTRVAAPGASLVVDDYDPLPADAAVRDLFAVENAAAELAGGDPALTFYPAALLRRVFAGYGWTFERERTLLDPVPWTESHVAAHADVARESAAELPPELGDPSVGRMYSLAFRLAGPEAA
ncbi:SAM-dependent methyltransferase [Halobacteriales archaeon QH_1_68_42]|nr:MAG: SAM-dependent methyltransferase [Halobacteriales archaeon QH_1_68_42]